MNRRSVLAAAAVVVSGGVAGCSSGASEPRCHLIHEIVEPPEDGEAVETYRYGELSEKARQAFRKALAEGSHSTTDRDPEPAEFRYWDTTTAYRIIYRDETHGLLTYTGEGCETGD